MARHFSIFFEVRPGSAALHPELIAALRPAFATYARQQAEWRRSDPAREARYGRVGSGGSCPVAHGSGLIGALTARLVGMVE
jgi:hypothetical protein